MRATRLRGPLAVTGVLLLHGCMPWVVGETAAILPPGGVEGAVGIAALGVPAEPGRPLPVPQARASMGIRDGVDAAVTWAAPLTFHGRARFRVAREGPLGATALAVGGGVHGLPDIAEAGERFWTPFATLDLLASTTGADPARYAALRLMVPVHPAEDGAATLWVAAQGGLELRAGRVRWGPEAGLVVTALRPERPILLLALSARRARLP